MQEPIQLVCAADDGYAMPLAAMVASVLANLGPDRLLCLYILDGGISRGNRQRILEVLGPGVPTEWLEPDRASLSGLKVSGHVNVAAYFRLMIPELLPRSATKAVYLDCDLIVRRDLSELWDLEVGEHWLLAAQDLGEPYVSSPRGLANYRELGLAAEQEYFNSGVLVIALDRWRQERVAEKVLRYLQENEANVRWWDQDGMNAVLAGKWGLLPPWWNQIPHIYGYRSFEDSPLTSEEYEAVLSEPAVVHFTTSTKPWHYDCQHPYRELFFEYLDLTPWAGWRPRRLLQKRFWLNCAGRLAGFIRKKDLRDG